MIIWVTRSRAYRGDSGKNQMKHTWRRLGTICKDEGIRHPQVDCMLKVPKVTPAATMAPSIQQHQGMTLLNIRGRNAPINHDALNNEPMRARSLGYASSPIIDDAATMANGIPKPNRKRAITNIATGDSHVNHLSDRLKERAYSPVRPSEEWLQ